MKIDTLKAGLRTGMHFFSDARSSQEIAALRVAVGDIIWRSRATLLTLLFFAALNLGLDQSADVLVGLAHALRHTRDSIGMLLAALGFALTLLAIWLYAYACWLWPRILLRMSRPDGLSDSPPAAQGFARHWARFLGCAPLLIILALSIKAASAAFEAGDRSSAWLLIGFGLTSLIGGAVFWWRRAVAGAERAQRGPWYYNAPADTPAGRGDIGHEHYRFLFFTRAGRDLLPICLVLFFLSRGLSLFVDALPAPLTLAVITSITAFWTCALSFLTRSALRHGTPWFLLILIVAVAFGSLGWTDNHRIWQLAPDAASTPTHAVLWLYLSGLTLAALLAAAIWCWQAKRHAPLLRRLAASLPFLLLAMLALPAVTDRHLPRQLATVTLSGAPDPRPSVPEALPAALAGQTNDAVIYLVSAEGGGIRSAYWTARSLAELTARDPAFPQRVLALSGVSGGSVGIAVWRSCLLDVRQRHSAPADIGPALIACVERFGATDLLTPLLSTWLFEDALARFIPSAWCHTPGCGFLTRAAWFERTLEQRVPGMSASLATQRGAARALSDPAWLPYVLFNATSVETGERHIASDLRIEPASFPSARDQLATLGAPMPVVAAAHNSARFPYTNPIGILRRASEDDCPGMLPDTRTRNCGHLADGGYFDNSGDHSLQDILRKLRQCQASAQCPRVRIELIALHNGLDARKPWLFQPADPIALAPSRLLTDLLSPPRAIFSAAGTGAAARRAEAALNAEFTLQGPGHIHPLDLLQNQPDTAPGGRVLYPLGWYLSPLARESMCEQARVRVGESALVRTSDSPACRVKGE